MVRCTLLLVALALATGSASTASAEELLRTFDPGDGGTLVIALDFGSVAVQPHDGDTLRIEARARGVGASGVRFRAWSAPGEVVLEGRAEPWVDWLHAAPGVRVNAWVPKGTRVRVRGRGDVEVLRGTDLSLAP